MGEAERQCIEAFEALSDELYRHASLRLPDPEQAQELTQEAFAKAWAYHQKSPIRQWRPFLYQTLRRLIIDEYRRKKSVSLEALAQEAELTPEELLPAEGDTLEQAIDRYDGALALQALRALPEPYRETLVLRYVDGLAPKEIAPLIGLSENAVSVRLHRGLKKLRDTLQHHA